ncbi:xanthine dehydrogenase family protein molybdopterin-binding subunit [Flaviflagellibacter deserti]|uniref:Xanthine dehydrogenase family protein molybdopterin-binding subunit n=1 Tax=Flaviflagellibacter deserti TaxID=2267266 RepID=A0ABV9Z024_9HYPH
MSAAAPEPKANMGQPVPRYDAREKVTGVARYASDQQVSQPAFAFLVTSAIARGDITSIDERGAREVPGVLDIFTHRNTDDLTQTKYGQQGGGASTSIQGLGPEIRHDGQIVAMVVADTFENAREAAYRLKIGYSEATPSASFESAGTEMKDANGIMSVATQAKEWLSTGDVEDALSKAAVTVDAEYSTPTQHHNPIELFTTTCSWQGDKLTIYEPSQFVFGLKNAVAERIDVAPDNIHVVSPYVGGAFGSKAQMTPRTGLVAYAARKVGRPVKLVATRDQGYTISTYRAETRHHVRLGSDRDGRLVAYSHEGFEITSRPDSYSVKGTEETAHLYSFGAVATKVNVVHADRNTPGFMRSPPVVPYVYALESALDELAVKLRMDPVELRRKNDGMKDSFGKEWSSRSLMTCYDQAAEAFGWSKRNPEPGSMRDGEWLVGWGCATAVYPTHNAASAARVSLRSTGEALVQIAVHDIGTGAYTVIGQLVASELGVPVEKVRVELGDTLLPAGPVAGGSVTTAAAGSAVLKACAQIRTRLIGGASSGDGAPLAGVPDGQIRLREGRAVAQDGRSEELAKLFERLGQNQIEEYAEFVPAGASSNAMERLYQGKPTFVGGSNGEKLMYSLGAEFVEVRVNQRTREVRCPRAIGAFAAGRILNTRTTHSQLMGGMIWGIASALHEKTELDEKRARYVNDNIAEYLIPVNADIRDIDIILVPEIDNEVNPVGVKGLGELANVGTAAAVANAVYHATGIRIRDLPVRIEALLA